MLKSSLTSLAVVVALAATVPGVADAAKPAPKPLAGGHAAPAQRIAARVDRRVAANPSLQGTNAVAVTAGATGDGPADQRARPGLARLHEGRGRAGHRRAHDQPGARPRLLRGLLGALKAAGG